MKLRYVRARSNLFKKSDLLRRSLNIFLFAAFMSSQICAAGSLLTADELKSHSIVQYPTVPMRSDKAEKDSSKGVLYMINQNLGLREGCRVVIRSGLVYNSNGEIQPDTKNENDNIQNYVMDTYGNFYLFDEYTTPLIRHSSIFGGAPVAGAGNIQIRNGRVTFIDSHSGHYDTEKVMGNVLRELQTDGVDIRPLQK